MHATPFSSSTPLIISASIRLLNRCKTLSQEKECPFEVSVSIGAVEYTNRDTNLDELLNRADANLYEEKRRKKKSHKI